MMALFKPEDHHDKLGLEWVEDRTAKVYRLVGIVFAEDDWYWMMCDVEGKYQWLSCVGSIENFGFTSKG